MARNPVLAVEVNVDKICIDCHNNNALGRNLRCGSCRYHRSGRTLCPDCGFALHKPVTMPLKTNRQNSRVTQILNSELEFGIHGTWPECNESSIYVLKRDNVVFYVGSSKNLINRMTAHKQKFGYDISMDIVRNVPDELSVIEECREIVAQHDSGITLANILTPDKGRKGR